MIISTPQVTGSVATFTINDKNASLVHTIRQTLIRDIPIYAFHKFAIERNDSCITNELLTNMISKLKINQKSLLRTFEDPSKHKFTLSVTAKDEYRIVTSDDISDSDAIIDIRNIYLCTLKKGEILNMEIELELGTKHGTDDTAFLSIGRAGVDKYHLLGTFPIQDLLKLARKILITAYSGLYEYMNGVASEFQKDAGLKYDLTNYDYVLMEPVCTEIHILYPDIKFCSYKKEHPSFDTSSFILVDSEKKESKKLKTAIDNIILRLSSL